MLNRNFAIALAVAMVLAVLYGCSSSGGIKNDRDMYKERANAAEAANTALMNRLYGEGGTADNPTPGSLMGMLNAADMSNTGLMEQIYGMGGSMAAPTADSLMGMLNASNMSNTDLMEQIYGMGGSMAAPTADSLMGRLTAANTSNDGLMEQIYGMGGSMAAPTADSLMGMLNAANMSNTDLMEQIYGVGGTMAAPTDTSLMGRLNASGTSNTGLMEQIYGMGGTADAPTADSLMGRLTAANTSNTGLMEQIYGMGGTADAPTDDSLMGRLNAATTSNTGLMEQIYGMGGTADAPTADSLMGRLTASGTSNTGLMEQIYGMGGTADAPTDESLMGRLNAAREQIYGVGGTADAPMADGLMAQLNALYMAAADDAIAHQKAIGMAIMGKVSTAGADITLGVDAVERMITATSTPELAEDEMAMWHDLSTEGWATSGFFMREEEVDHDNDGDTADVTRNTKVAVYSNVEGPQGEEFGMYYTAAATPGLPGVTSVVRNEADDADDGVQLDAGTGATGIAALAGWVMGDGFPTTPPTGETAMRAWVDDADTEAVNESEPSFPGSFRGVMGMYKCTSGPCSASVNDKGDLTNLAGTWAFRPDDYTSEIAGVSPDSEYAYFGFWLEVTEDEDGKETFGIRGVAGGGGVAYTDIQISATDLMGKATFSGDATGKYMAKKLTPYGQIADAVSGQFIADVNMTAVFGDVQDELLGDQNKVWGTVDNFRDPVEADSAALMSRMAADGTDASWSVDLNRANISSTGLDDHAGDDSFFGGTTTGDGSWTAQFFGGEDKTKMPGHVAGTFDAHFSNGHVVGGFAAENNAPAE